MTTFISQSEKDTEKFGIKLAKTLKGGEVLALFGDLGSGKTFLSKVIAKGLKTKQEVNSPTFVVMKIYDLKNEEIKKLCHIDAYRLNSEEDLIAIGALDYLGKKDTVTIIEWAEKIKKILPKKAIKIKLEHLKEKNERKITIK